jgi:hypothetical protein
VDVGYGTTEIGDSALGDVGLQLADAVTPVDELRVWVDRPLPPEVATGYAWSAYRSDDNVTWTAIPLSAPAQFLVLEPRFEIPIARTQARFLELVASPLPVGITSSSTFRSVLVTEVRAFAAVACDAQ